MTEDERERETEDLEGSGRGWDHECWWRNERKRREVKVKSEKQDNTH